MVLITVVGDYFCICLFILKQAMRNQVLDVVVIYYFHKCTFHTAGFLHVALAI